MSRRLFVLFVALAGVLLHTGRADPQPLRPPAVVSTIGASYNVAHWTTADGLPQNSVLDVLPLGNGEMWLATFGGLASFDGVRFEVVDMAVDDAMPSHRIVGLEADSADAFWFLTQSGHLGRAKGGRTVSVVAPPNLAQDAIGLVADGAGQLLGILRDGTLWRSDGRTSWVAVPPPPSQLGPHLSVTARKPGAVVAWKGRLLSWGPRGLVDEAELPRERMDLFSGPDDQLWLADGPSIWRFHDGRFEPLTITPRLTTAVTAVAAAPDDSVWVATRGEVSRLERRAAGDWQRVPIPLGLESDMFVRQLVLDPQGSLWVGTDGQGLYRVSTTPARRVSPPSVRQAALGMAPDGDGGAFVARSCLELHHVDRHGTTRRVAIPDRVDSRTDIGCGLSLARAGSGAAYVRFGQRLFRVTRVPLAVQLITEGLSADEGPIVTAPDGAVWIVSRRGVVERLSSDGRLQTIASVAAPAVSATLAPDGSLWVGGEGSVAHLTDSNVVTFGADARVPRGPVRDMLADADGTVWIGTYGGGLGRLRDGRVSRLTTADGLPDNSISRILGDTRGRFWISTNRGVAVADRAELVAAAEGTRTGIVPVVFGSERGVPEANFGSPAGFSTDDGQLWFSTIEGPVVIDAAAFPANAAPPALRFERVSADDQLLPLGAEVAVPPQTRRVRLDLSTTERLYPRPCGSATASRASMPTGSTPATPARSPGHRAGPAGTVWSSKPAVPTASGRRCRRWSSSTSSSRGGSAAPCGGRPHSHSSSRSRPGFADVSAGSRLVTPRSSTRSSRSAAPTPR